MSTSTNPHRWLNSTVREAGTGRYRHQLLKENRDYWPEIRDTFRAYVIKAHQDALRRMRHLAEISLDPLVPKQPGDPGAFYPHRLNQLDQQGYIGEILAGWIAEHHAPLGESEWKVPAFLFRFHNVAFERLEACMQTGNIAARVPGRTGDDCLAFVRNEQGWIVKILYCESKCTKDHRKDLIDEAHGKVSSSAIVGWLQLVEILKDSEDPEAPAWIKAILHARLATGTPPWERCDLVCYACGQRPTRNPTWIQTDKPHNQYRAGRRLEAVEIHLSDVEKLVRDVYAEEVWQ